MRDHLAEQEVLPRFLPFVVFWQSFQKGLTVDSQASVAKTARSWSVGFPSRKHLAILRLGVTVELEKTAGVLTLAMSLALSYFLVG